MTQAVIQIVPERLQYRPGEEIRGAVSWALERAPELAELRLFWQTKGKGDRDTATVATLVFEAPAAADTRPFTFAAPAFPYTFSGKLISLDWALELVLDPDGAQAAAITLSPSGEEIILHAPGGIAMEEPGKTPRWRKS
jgi:hypothetical protein